MNKYRIPITVDIHDVDYNGIVKTSSVLRYLQTAAQTQLTEGGMSYDSLYARHRAFILSQIKLEIFEPIRAYTPLTAITFPCESRGFSFIRCYQLMKGSKCIGRAASIWALVDINNHSLIKVNDFNLPLELGVPLDISVGHIKMPSDMLSVGTYRVTYGDLDQNRHVNNTKYADIYSNFLPLDGKRIDSISIHYANEARWGEELNVLMKECDGFYYIRTVKPDGKINSEAEIHLTDI
jgi:medium-chain acyl-[acyl-carrier-protein] hydrolase